MTPTIEKITTDVMRELKPIVAVKTGSSPDVSQMVSAAKIDFEKEYEEPPTCISVGGSRFATLGNFSVIIGKAKSRKSYLTSLLISECLDNKSEILQVTLPKDKQRVILIDTEQSDFDVMKSIRSYSGHLSQKLDAYALRSFKPRERVSIIQNILETSENTGVVIIDGIRDLVNDINSPEEATELSTNLLKWTNYYRVHIITVLHQNKGDNNARGHVGTEAVNKAETVLSVEKDNEISIVNPEFCRGKDFSQFAFGISETGMPYILNDWQQKAEKGGRPKSLSPYEIPKETHTKILNRVFSIDGKLQYKDLISHIQTALDEMGVRIGQVKAREYYTYYIVNKRIVKGRTIGERFDTYSLLPLVN